MTHEDDERLGAPGSPDLPVAVMEPKTSPRSVGRDADSRSRERTNGRATPTSPGSTAERPAAARRVPRGYVPARPIARHALAGTKADRRRAAWRIFGLATVPIGGLLLLVLVAGGLFALQVLQVRDDLEAARSQLKVLAEAAVSTDIEQLQASGDEVVARTQRAYDTSNGPLWDLAAALPEVGNNVTAVRTVADMVNTVASQSVPPVVDMVSAADLEGGRSAGALGIDLEPFLKSETVLPSVIASFEEATAIAASMDRTNVLPAVYEPLDEMTQLLTQATPILKVVEAHLPALLHAAGADGPMLYQLMIQTPAEIRATGGGPGHWLVVKVENGHVDLLGQENGVELMYSQLPELGFDTVSGSLIDLPEDTQTLYPDELTNWSSNFTMTPHFPRAVELFQATRDLMEKPEFDGVISIDPVVLAHLLEATGPLTLASGETVTAENAGALLMSEPYERFGADNAQMDAFFHEVTTVMFDALTGGNWEFGPMWDQVVRSAEEGRVFLWFDDPGLQSLAHEYGLDGALREDNIEATQLGIYFNDYSVGKLNYWMHYSQGATCNVVDRTITVTMDLRSDMTEAIESEYTLGLRNGFRGIDPRTMMLSVLFFAPPGAEILWTDPEEGDWQDSYDWEGQPFYDREGEDHGNTAVSKTLLLGMGETRTISYEVQLPDGPLGPLEVRHTPGANDTPVTVDASCASLFGSPDGSNNITLSKIG